MQFVLIKMFFWLRTDVFLLSLASHRGCKFCGTDFPNLFNLTHSEKNQTAPELSSEFKIKTFFYRSRTATVHNIRNHAKQIPHKIQPLSVRWRLLLCSFPSSLSTPIVVVPVCHRSCFLRRALARARAASKNYTII